MVEEGAPVAHTRTSFQNIDPVCGELATGFELVYTTSLVIYILTYLLSMGP